MAKIAVYLVPYYHTFCIGQSRPYCLNYQNSSGELASTRFTYDSRGRNTRGLYQQIMGGRSSKNLHEFDAKGRMIRKFREYNDGETSEEIFQYDTRGKLVREAFQSSTGISGSALYAYDRKKNAIAMECDNYKGWFSGRLEFGLDKEGKRREGVILQDGKKVGEIQYKYETPGNLIQEDWTIGSNWSQTFQYVYESAE